MSSDRDEREPGRMRAEAALRDAERRAIERYEGLIAKLERLAMSLGATRDLATIFRDVSDFARAATGADGTLVMTFDSERETLQAAFAWSDGEVVDVSNLPVVPLGGGPNSRAIKTGQVIITDDFEALASSKSWVVIGESSQRTLSSIVAPMAVGGKIVGTVQVQSYARFAFAQEHATAMRMAANLAAVAVENVRLLEREAEREEQLLQSQKMEAVGRLAGGIAHDFNNLMTVITGYSDLALRRIGDNAHLAGDLSEIKRAGERAAELTHRLLAFSRKQILQPKVFNVNDTVAEVDRMLHRLIGEDVELTLALDSKIGPVLADPGQIEQVLVNLAVNARDAMPDGGRFGIATSEVEVDACYAARHLDAHPGRFVTIAASDTGCGMSEATLARAFEPFFTTKPQGRGTGLGLSTVYGIVRQSDGWIEIESEQGRGTTFTVFLPRVAPETSEPEDEPSVEAPRGTETILLTEDEAMVRKFTAITLAEAGYTVLEAASGEEAIAICARHEGEIDLLLTDVVMPKMSGPQIAREVLAARPRMAVIFMSGYTDDAIVHHGIHDNSIEFVGKPFRPDELAEKVRQVLDAARARRSADGE